MEKETSLSNSMDRMVDSEEELHNKLDQFCEIIGNKYDTELYFCEILGKRWSYIAGPESSYLPQGRCKVTDKYGFMYKKEDIDSELKQEIKSQAKKLIDNYEQ